MIPLSDWFPLALASSSWPHVWGELLVLAASTGAVGMGLSDITSGLSERLSSGGDAGGELAGEDDPAGVDDGFGDDEFGDWDGDQGDELDDWGGDEGLDDLGGDGGGHSDLEPRLDELENEVATISSTMGTVRSENEAINETVEDIEDNIRKLLEIYEMVTRGVNPFVDDAQAGGGGMGGSFGLFEDTDDDGGVDDLDPDVADADPDSFFDDDFDEDFDEDDFDEEFSTGDESVDDGGSATDETASTPPGDSSGDGDDGKTFEELKSEYESGTADWQAEDESEPDSDGPAPEPEPEEATDLGDATATGDVEPDTDQAVIEGGGETTGPVDSSPNAGPPSEVRSGSPDEERRRDDTSENSGRESHDSDGKPYLGSLPAGYGAELLVIEWLSYLRERSSTSEALRAINYYQNIGWIGAPAASSLQEYLSGLAEGEATPTSTGGTQLTIDHHTHSLRYIGELGGKHVDVERLDWSGAGRDSGRIERRGQRGIQR